MAEQGHEYDQYAPQTSGRLFSNAMFGFNKEEVLEYLEDLADENYQRQQNADIRIQELSQKIQTLEAGAVNFQTSDADSAADRAHFNELTQDLEVARAASQQAEEDLQEVKEQLFNLQQENNWLREEYQKCDHQIADLRRQLDDASAGQWSDTEQQIEELRTQLEEAQEALAAQEYEGPSPAAQAASTIIEEANADAERIRQDAYNERDRLHRQILNSTSGISASISTLRGDISDTEGDVSNVLEQVQEALASVLAALGRTEQNLNTLGVQVERFPATSSPVQKPQQQVVYFQPTTQPITSQPAPPPAPASKQNAGLYAAPASSYGSGGFRRVWPDEETRAPRTQNAKPFRPSYTGSPTAQALAYAPQYEPAYEPAPDYAAEARMRNLSESLVDTLLQMMREST